MSLRDAPSLDELRDIIRNNQRSGDTNPTDPAKQVVVTNSGRLAIGSQTDEDPETLSLVPQETFAGRVEDEQLTVELKMPETTAEATIKGTAGWYYSFENEFADEFEMFAYYDGQHYQVVVVRPELEEKWMSPHTGHIFASGRICFGNAYGSGRKTLEDAYSKSVLWSNGISAAMRDFKFPFSINNEND